MSMRWAAAAHQVTHSFLVLASADVSRRCLRLSATRERLKPSSALKASRAVATNPASSTLLTRSSPSSAVHR